jgi:hypothetical protein
MSLLDQLSNHTCAIGFCLEELTPAVSIDSIPSEASERSLSKSKHSSYELVATTVVSPERKKYAGLTYDL